MSAELTAIRAAWDAMFDDQPFDPDQPVAETGADSLRLMHFVLRLEQSLGRRIGYELLGPETTARSLAAVLASDMADTPDLPQIFFLAGLGGDNLMLGFLRNAFAGELAFTMVDAPGLDQPEALLTDLPATGRWIADRIARLQPEGELRLAGYSIGGLQAFEAARHLVATGRVVSMLLLIDTAPVRGAARRLLDALRAPAELPRRIVQRLPRLRRTRRLGAHRSLRVDLALRFGAYGAASRAARATAGPAAPADYGEPDLFRLWHLRASAARRWRPAPLDVAVLLAVSDDGERWGVPHFWRKLVPELTLLRLRGSHTSMATADNVMRLQPALRSQLGRSS